MQIKQNVQIIHTLKSIESVGKHAIVQITIVWIVRDVPRSEGQISWAILYMYVMEGEEFKAIVTKIILDESKVR